MRFPQYLQGAVSIFVKYHFSRLLALSLGTKLDCAALKWKADRKTPKKKFRFCSHVGRTVCPFPHEFMWVVAVTKAYLFFKSLYLDLENNIFKKRVKGGHFYWSCSLNIKLIHSRWNHCLMCDFSKERKVSICMLLQMDTTLVTYGY